MLPTARDPIALNTNDRQKYYRQANMSFVGIETKYYLTHPLRGYEKCRDVREAATSKILYIDLFPTIVQVFIMSSIFKFIIIYCNEYDV